jgi:hypothetical protein
LESGGSDVAEAIDCLRHYIVLSGIMDDHAYELLSELGARAGSDLGRDDQRWKSLADVLQHIEPGAGPLDAERLADTIRRVRAFSTGATDAQVI